MDTPRSHYRGYRFPPEIISYCVWLYFRFSMSFRDVELLMAQRGVIVTYETTRSWCERFGRDYAKRIRARSGELGNTWHLDEVFIKIGGRLHYLWRAVDQAGSVLDILIQSKRSKKASTPFRRLLPRLTYAARAVVTDKLASYRAVCAELLPNALHLRGKALSNRGENSRLPMRERERRVRRFKSSRHAQRFLSTFGMIADLFNVGRHLMSAASYRVSLGRRFAVWKEVTGVPAVA